MVDEHRREVFITRAHAYFPNSTPRQAAKRELDGLTAREREVAGHIAQGKTNREIAEAMVFTEF